MISTRKNLTNWKRHTLLPPLLPPSHHEELREVRSDLDQRRAVRRLLHAVCKLLGGHGLPVPLLLHHGGVQVLPQNVHQVQEVAHRVQLQG